MTEKESVLIPSDGHSQAGTEKPAGSSKGRTARASLSHLLHCLRTSPCCSGRPTPQPLASLIFKAIGACPAASCPPKSEQLQFPAEPLQAWPSQPHLGHSGPSFLHQKAPAQLETRPYSLTQECLLFRESTQGNNPQVKNFDTQRSTHCLSVQKNE